MHLRFNTFKRCLWDRFDCILNLNLIVTYLVPQGCVIAMTWALATSLTSHTGKFRLGMAGGSRSRIRRITSTLVPGTPQMTGPRTMDGLMTANSNLDSAEQVWESVQEWLVSMVFFKKLYWYRQSLKTFLHRILCIDYFKAGHCTTCSYLLPIGPPWSSFSYVNWELSWWDDHLSVTSRVV